MQMNKIPIKIHATHVLLLPNPISPISRTNVRGIRCHIIQPFCSSIRLHQHLHGTKAKDAGAYQICKETGIIITSVRLKPNRELPTGVSVCVGRETKPSDSHSFALIE